MLTLRAPARGPFRLPQSQPCRRPETSGEFHLTASRLPPRTRQLPTRFPWSPPPSQPSQPPQARRPQDAPRSPSGTRPYPYSLHRLKAPPWPSLRPCRRRRPDALPQPLPAPTPAPPPHPPHSAPPALGGGGGQDFVALHREVRVQTGKLFIPKRRWDVRRPSGARQGGY